MATTYKTYNLPGFGMMRVGMFPYVKRVYDFLENYGHISLLREINQLGGLRDVFPGAHHTRYEYVMAQMAIITELCHLKGHLPADITLSSKFKKFGRLPGEKRDPSCGDLLMVLVLLTNVGHLPSTFSGERAFLYHLKSNSNSRRAFRSGLPKEIRSAFDKCLDEFNTYKVNNFLTSFLLERYRRKEGAPEIVDFCQAILRAYLLPKESLGDQKLSGLVDLFKSIRRLTFLALDSLYTPVPFSLDLASIFISLEHFLGEVFNPQSSFQGALTRLEGVMRDTVYLSPHSVLTHAQITSDSLDLIGKNTESFESISGIRDTLVPQTSKVHFGVTTKINEPSDVYSRTVVLTYRCDPQLSSQVMDDPVKWEQTARKRIGFRSCMFGMEWDPPKTHLKVAAGLYSEQREAAQKGTALKVAKQLCDFDIAIYGKALITPRARWKNGSALITFLLESLLDGERKVRLKAPPIADLPPVFVENGSTKVASKVDEYYEWAKSTLPMDKDELHEIRMLSDALKAIEYRGTLIAFAGATEIINNGKIEAEFDGLVLMLSRPLDENPLIIVEAKNMQNGHTEARNQLTQRIEGLGIAKNKYQLNDLGTLGAYGQISF